MKMKSWLAVAIGLLLCEGMNAQEQWGLRLGTYAGVNGLALNPASGAGFDYQVDVNLLSGHFFLETNYVWLRKSSLFGLGLKIGNLDFVEARDYDLEPQAFPGDVVFEFADDARKRYLYSSATITGPSALFRLKGGHSLGWIVQGRFAMGGQRLPNNLSYIRYDRRPDLEPFPMHRWEMGMVAWSEIGLHYGRQWQTGYGKFHLGLTAKYLMGYEGFYFQNNTDLDAYTKITGDTIAAEKMDLSYSYTRSNLGAPPFQLVRNGSGFSADLGAEWTFDGAFDPHQYKVGVSLLDIGAIRFSGEQVVKHHAVSSKPVVLPNGDFDFIDSPEDLDQMVRLFSQHTLGDSAASFVGNEYTLWMPSAISIQGEFGFFPFLWIHGALVQQIPHPGAAIERGNAIMLAPRFEKRWLAAGLPITLYNMEQLRVGAFVRVGPLVLGTDHFPGFLIPGRLSGVDFYFALHWPFNLTDADISGGRSPNLKGRGVKCYHF